MSASVAEIRKAKKETQLKQSLPIEVVTVQEVELTGGIREILDSVLTEENTDYAIDLLDSMVDFPGPDAVWHQVLDQLFPGVLKQFLYKLIGEKGIEVAASTQKENKKNAKKEESKKA